MNLPKCNWVVLGKDKIEGLWNTFAKLNSLFLNPEREIPISLKAIIMSLQCQGLITLAFGQTSYNSDLKKAKAVLTNTYRQTQPTSRHSVLHVVPVACRHCTINAPGLDSGLSAYRRFEFGAESISY